MRRAGDWSDGWLGAAVALGALGIWLNANLNPVGWAFVVAAWVCVALGVRP